MFLHNGYYVSQSLRERKKNSFCPTILKNKELFKKKHRDANDDMILCKLKGGGKKRLLMRETDFLLSG